ncbi:MAG: dihydroxyacetone kinase subunit DhaK [Sulfitobacter sp.]|uniref:dihydroxyacetone kinase subunit DhaK n=1 Tax=Celeribacter marinus TaxID=1397108 RepID=UPI00317EE8BD
MAQFINKKEHIVQDTINGIVAASGGKLSRLDGYPFIRVVVRSDWDKSKVALVSGGGSGHEPAHAGFVGEGMLTAAVCGDVFASPSVDAVLAGILAVTGKAGCVLIVKNYTGDRLNFGLAAARAREMGLRVNMVVVEDDIAIPDLPKPRSVAGTLFVHKIAGARAEAGGDLGEVTQAAQRAAINAFSIGMSLTSCTIPGTKREERIPDGQIELGLGIHGESGAQQVPFLGAKQAISDAVAKLEPHLTAQPYVALINNLGTTTSLEMSVLTTELLNSRIGSKISHVVGPAAMMTALDMHGFSLSLYPLSDEDTALLTAYTPLPAWPKIRRFLEPKLLSLPDISAGSQPLPSPHPKNSALIRACCEALIFAEEDLNALDAKTGDGDTGATVATAAREVINRLDHLPLADLTQLFPAISRELTQTMGGSSGVLLAIFFSAAGEASASGHAFSSALKFGLNRIKEVGGAKLGDRTMIDALEPALGALDAGLQSAATAARNGASKTATMARANAGRSTYINATQLKGHVDPGAEAVARVFEHLQRQFS